MDYLRWPGCFKAGKASTPLLHTVPVQDMDLVYYEEMRGAPGFFEEDDDEIDGVMY